MVRTAFMGAHRRIQAYGDIGDILGSGGTAYAMIPIGDQDHENAGRTTVTTVGAGAGDGLVFTYSEAIQDFDTSLFYRHNQLWLPDAPFNGTDEEADSPDAAFWTRNDGASEGLSIGAWLNITDTAGIRIILSKWDDDQAVQEWLFFVRANDTLRLLVRDDSVPTTADRTSDGAILQGQLAFFVVTYDGSGGSSAMDGVTLYQNGVVLASTATNSGTYVAMENGTSTVGLGARFNATSAKQQFFDGRILGGPVGPFFTQQELTAAQVAELYRIGVAAQG